MPTNKPILQVVIDEETYLQFKELCNEENCKLSAKAKELIIEYVAEKKQDTTKRLQVYAEKIYKLTNEKSTP